jgi:predicted amino acid-binding ACT domain protein
MAFTIRRVDYFHFSVQDRPGEAYKLLTLLAEVGVNLLAFTAIPHGPMRTELTLFPESTSQLQSAATKARMAMDGPHHALLAQGDDELGALAGVHERIYEAGVNVASASGVTDGRGSYGYVIYVRPEEFDKVAKALGV